MNTENDFDDQQRWIDDLLRRGAIADSETPPESLRQSFRAAVACQRRRGRLLACGLAAAASLLIAAGWVLHTRQYATVVQHTIDRPSNESTSLAALNPHVSTNRATFVSSGDSIAVPIASKSPNVTVIRIYPAFQTDFSAPPNDDINSTDDDLAWPDELNGG